MILTCILLIVIGGTWKLIFLVNGHLSYIFRLVMYKQKLIFKRIKIDTDRWITFKNNEIGSTVLLKILFIFRHWLRNF